MYVCTYIYILTIGGEWQFEHAELTSASIDVLRISGEARVLLRRCVGMYVHIHMNT